MNKKIDKILSQDLGYQKLAIKFANVMVDEIFKKKHEIFYNHINKLDKKKSVLRHFKDWTFLFISYKSRGSDAGNASCYSSDQLKKSLNLRGRRYRQKHRSGYAMKITGWCSASAPLKDDYSYYIWEYPSIRDKIGIGDGYTKDGRIKLLAIVAHELAHIVCDFIRRWAKHGNHWEQSMEWGKNPLHKRLARLPWNYKNPGSTMPNPNNLDIVNRYIGHQKGWQEVYKILRDEFVNDYMITTKEYNEINREEKIAAKNV